MLALAEMQGPKHRRRSSSDGELLKMLEKYVDLPGSIKYRERFGGKVNPDVLKKAWVHAKRNQRRSMQIWLIDSDGRKRLHF